MTLSGLQRAFVLAGLASGVVSMLLVGAAVYYDALFIIDRTNPVRYEYLVGAILCLTYASLPAVVCAAAVGLLRKGLSRLIRLVGLVPVASVLVAAAASLGLEAARQPDPGDRQEVRDGREGARETVLDSSIDPMKRLR